MGFSRFQKFKKNSFRGNYLQKYGIRNVLLNHYFSLKPRLNLKVIVPANRNIDCSATRNLSQLKYSLNMHREATKLQEYFSIFSFNLCQIRNFKLFQGSMWTANPLVPPHEVVFFSFWGELYQQYLFENTHVYKITHKCAQLCMETTCNSQILRKSQQKIRQSSTRRLSHHGKNP